MEEGGLWDLAGGDDSEVCLQRCGVVLESDGEGAAVCGIAGVWRRELDAGAEFERDPELATAVLDELVEGRVEFVHELGAGVDEGDGFGGVELRDVGCGLDADSAAADDDDLLASLDFLRVFA